MSYMQRSKRIQRLLGVLVTLALMPLLFVGGGSGASARQGTADGGSRIHSKHEDANTSRDQNARYCIDPSGRPCSTPVPAHNKRTRWQVRKFRNGKMGRVRHMPWKKFAHPKRSKRRVKRLFRQEARQHPNGRLAAMGPMKAFHRFSRDAKCIGDGRYNPYTTGFDLCGYTGRSGDTKEGIKRGGSVILCGGSIAVAIYTAGGFGLTAASTSATCGFGVWQVWDGD